MEVEVQNSILDVPEDKLVCTDSCDINHRALNFKKMVPLLLWFVNFTYVRDVAM